MLREKIKWLDKRYNILRRNRIWMKFAKSNSPNNILSRLQKNEIKSFYRQFGINIDTCFHNFYTEKTGIYSVNYIPDSLYYNYIDQYFNDWGAAKYFDNKCFYKYYFPLVKMPETILLRINNFWCTPSHEIIPKADVISYLTEESDFFVKDATDSEGGHGVKYYTKNLLHEFSEIYLQESSKQDVIIQRCLKQCNELAILNPSSVNTIRVLSLLRDNEVKIYSCILRMGCNNSKVDNASSGGITCGINFDGRLKEIAYSARGKKFQQHPSSGLKFCTIKIPVFSKVLELVKEMHPKIPHFRLVSWDIAIDDNYNPVLIETNLKYGELDFHQLNNGPLFGDDTRLILQEVFS